MPDLRLIFSHALSPYCQPSTSTSSTARSAGSSAVVDAWLVRRAERLESVALLGMPDTSFCAFSNVPLAALVGVCVTLETEVRRPARRRPIASPR
jgi:hypothetical protein